VVESTALEMRRTGNCTGGSNPSLSASKQEAPRGALCLLASVAGDETLFEKIARGDPKALAEDENAPKRVFAIPLFGTARLTSAD
jgi:hypothetical protein